jgi:SAC3 family protein LENG8/THP3
MTLQTDPSKIRPESILKLALALLRERYGRKTIDYLALCNQMKSIRQDLTVQHIRNRFAVEVYEEHARMALENGDFGEFNQCQTQLTGLYEANVGCSNETEFTSYRILFQLSCDGRSHANLLHDLQALRGDQTNSPLVRDALKVCQALYSHDYQEFFRLSRVSSPLGQLVISRHFKKVRKSILQSASKSYRTQVPLSWLSKQLNFDSVKECRDFLGPQAQIQSDPTQSGEFLVDLKSCLMES